jgi:putative tryptophan/tyrosine transport system substrate-binding protein
MRRRDFIAALFSAAAWPLAAHAQQSGKIPRIGVLWHAGNEQEEAIFLGALRKGLDDLGYVEGKNIELKNRFADEHYDRFDALAAELVEAKVDIIVASITSAALRAKRLTTIPIVVAYGNNFVEFGLAQSLAHPGGNVTGLSAVFVDLAAKHLELLNDSIAKLSAVTLLANATTTQLYRGAYISELQKAADALHVSLHVVQVSSPDELEQAISSAANAHSNAVLIQPDGLFFQQRKRIAELAMTKGLATIGWTVEIADAGALMSYGADAPDLFRRAATYVDKILKGTNPADLPIEQPTKLQLVINLKTAKSINMTIPSTVLFRADKVIE